MRISTGMIFNAGLSGMQRQTATLLQTQQQLSSGKRILTPSDDPVAAAQALDLTQAQGINKQYGENQDSATDMLGLQDNQLNAASNLLARARELAVQAGNAALTMADRRSIGTELRSIFDQMLGIANTADANGQFQFSGFSGSNKPFAGTVETGVTYSGDDGQRLLQVSPSRQMAVSDSGNDVFVRIPSGNGTFSTAAAASNTGSGVIDAGSVLDPTKWAAGNIPATGLQIVFSVVGGATTYDIQYAAAPNTSLLTAPIAYTSGDPIPLLKQTAPAADYGAQVVLNGQPANGDVFTIKPSTSQDAFTTLRGLITSVEAPTTVTGGATRLANSLGSALTNLDQASNNILKVRATVGARMNEIEALQSASSGLDLQYSTALSRLQDVDYAAAITRMTQEQTSLQAAQQSFVKISSLSLFNFLT